MKWKHVVLTGVTMLAAATLAIANPNPSGWHGQRQGDV